MKLFGFNLYIKTRATNWLANYGTQVSYIENKELVVIGNIKSTSSQNQMSLVKLWV